MDKKDRKIKLPFLNGGKEIELPDLTDPDVETYTDLLAIRVGVERDLEKLGFTSNTPKPKDDNDYFNILARKMNIRTVTYILKKLDPAVKDRDIKEHGKKNPDFFGLMILKMYGEDEKDFQEPDNPAQDQETKEPAKKN